MTRILVVEDEPKVARALREGLLAAGYEVVSSGDGAEAHALAGSADFAAVVLDLMLPGRSGLEVLAAVRARGSTPVLVLTARDAVEDRVQGLDAGADDYLVKPFAFAELLARLRALLRRGQAEPGTQFTAADLAIDRRTRTVARGGRPVELTVREYEVLEYLVRHKGEVVTREMLARDVWQETMRATSLDNVIDVHIARLRRKVDHDGERLIQTVRGVGFIVQERAVSIRARLTLWCAATIALVLLAFAMAANALLARRLAAALDVQLADDKEVAEQLLERDPGGGLALKARGHGSDPPLAFSFAVQAIGGRVLLTVPSGPPPWTGALFPEWREHRTVGEGEAAMRVFSDPELVDGLAVVIHVARSEAAVRAQVRELTLVSLVLLPVGVLIAAAGGLFLARKALLPVARMAEQAQRISAERLGERMPVVNPRDELGQLAQAFNDTLARLERSFAQLRQFTADASHELRTPLTAMRTVGEVGLRNERDVAGCREVIASMLEEAERLTRLTDTLLLLARSDAGALPLSWSSVALCGLAREVVATLAVLAEEKHLEVTVEAAAEVHVRGDRTLLRQVVMNLLDNAIQHSDAGGRIALAVEAGAGGVSCSVRDEGPGIAPEHRGRLFERFFRADPARSRDRGGAGLGLALARSIVGLHGGSLELVDHPGRGAWFRIRLPDPDQRPTA